MSHKNAVTVLEQGLAVCVAHQIHDAPMRARMAEDAIRGALGFLADVGEAAPAEPFEPYNAPDQMNPTRRLYEGEDFTVFERFCSEDGSSAIITADLEYAKTGEHDFTSRPASDFFEDVLIAVLREDLARTVGPAESRAVADDEIDEDPEAGPDLSQRVAQSVAERAVYELRLAAEHLEEYEGREEANGTRQIANDLAELFGQAVEPLPELPDDGPDSTAPEANTAEQGPEKA